MMADMDGFPEASSVAEPHLFTVCRCRLEGVRCGGLPNHTKGFSNPKRRLDGGFQQPVVVAWAKRESYR